MPKNTSLTKQRTEIRFRAKIKENFLAVQGLRLGAFTAVGLDSIPGWGTKILQATWRGKTKQNKTKLKILVHHQSSHPYIHCAHAILQMGRSAS